MKTKILVSLGPIFANQARELAYEKNPRIKNWRGPIASTRTGIATHNLGRYSSRCKYIHYEYSPTLTSFGVILRGGSGFAGRVSRQGFNLSAPKDFIFAGDSLGAKIQSRDGKRDYHFNSDEIFDGMGAIMRRARANWKAQAEAAKAKKESARIEKIKARELKSVRVTLGDSRRAGNCVEGSLRYAETRLGISRQQILDGDYLFSVSAENLLRVNGDERVHRAVNVAWQRETLVSI
ncbi:MAG: hypothetical protein KGL39_22875 [Patescibacteria group bacterium]|nr:hypothetical protein [Patescibacteria group bacterium]